MTKEEKINVVKNIRNYMVSGNPIWDKDTVYEALSAAIKALESTDTNECVDLISRDKVLNLVLDACTDVMDECETVTGICGEEVYTDVREVDAILKCNKRIRNGIRQLPSEPVRISEQLEWIPCAKKLPEEEEKSYWVCTDGGYQCQCRWTNISHISTNLTTSWHWHIVDVPQHSKVVAWMPLPEVMKEGEPNG